MKILIIKLSSIGDVIHTLPAFSVIREAFPKSEIAWVVEKGSAEILRNNPLISKLIEIDTKSLRKKDSFSQSLSLAKDSLRQLYSIKYDVAIDFQGLLKSAMIAKISRAKNIYGFSKELLREPASRFLLTDTFSVESQTNVINKNILLAKKVLKISGESEKFNFPIFTDEKHKTEAEEIISSSGANFVILNPATSWATKLWDAEKYGHLADKLWEKLGLVSVITTAPNEKDLANKVLNAGKSGKMILSTPSLKGFYELAKRALVYVGGDTGPMFLAVAAQTPIVGIFGPTEWWRNGSPNKDDICVERTDISCRINCHRRTCSKWICMDIDVETVFRAVEKRLKKADTKIG